MNIELKPRLREATLTDRVGKLLLIPLFLAAELMALYAVAKRDQLFLRSPNVFILPVLVAVPLGLYVAMRMRTTARSREAAESPQDCSAVLVAVSYGVLTAVLSILTSPTGGLLAK